MLRIMGLLYSFASQPHPLKQKSTIQIRQKSGVTGVSNMDSNSS